MSNFTIGFIALIVVAVIVAASLLHFVIWPSILEDRQLRNAVTYGEEDNIPDEYELEDDDEYDEDEDDDEYDDDEDDDPFLPADKEPSILDTITRLARTDHLALIDMRRELFRDAHPEFYTDIQEYRERWRAIASEHKREFDTDRARYRKREGLSIAA